MNKKGDLLDGFQNLIGLVVGAIALIVVAFAMTSIGDEMETKTGFDTAEVAPFWTTVASMPVFLDWGVLLVTLIVLGGSLILYYFTDMQPFMYIVSWLLTIILTIAIIIVGSAFPTLVNAFPSIVSQMIFIPFLISNVHWIALIYFVISLITLHVPK